MDTRGVAGIQCRAGNTDVQPMPTATVSESASVPQPTGEPRRARRLLAVAAVDQPGGAETTLLRLLSSLRERGWQVTLATPGDGPLRAAGESAGHRCLSLPVGGLAAGAARARRPGRGLAAGELADVVYLAGLLPARARAASGA